jgi:hypothetical protein
MGDGELFWIKGSNFDQWFRHEITRLIQLIRIRDMAYHHLHGTSVPSLRKDPRLFVRWWPSQPSSTGPQAPRTVRFLSYTKSMLYLHFLLPWFLASVTGMCTDSDYNPFYHMIGVSSMDIRYSFDKVSSDLIFLTRTLISLRWSRTFTHQEPYLDDTSEKRLRMRAYQSIFLEFKRVLVWKEMLLISEYTNKITGILLWDKDIVLMKTLWKN